MILLHGSSVVVSKPDMLHSRENLDFGKGFYTTPIHAQAEKWCERFRLRYGASYISKYKLNDAVFAKGYIPKETALERLRFESPNIQYCFKDQKTVSTYLTFIGSEAL